MKRRVVLLVTALTLLFSAVFVAKAYTNKELRAADALYHLDLFRGRSAESKVYDLDAGLNRVEGTVILLRVIGAEEKANLVSSSENPFVDFTDVTVSWAIQEVTYAYKAGLVKGTSSTTFNPKGEMTDYMFLTLLLRQLGYKDGNKETDTGIDFVWNKPYALAKSLGLIDSVTPDTEFTRGEAALASWRAMEVKIKNSEQTLAGNLIAAGVFTNTEYAEAQEIWLYGSIQDDSNSEEPTTSTTPTVPDSGDSDSGSEDEDGEQEIVLPWENGGKQPSEYTWAEFEKLSADQQMAFQNWFGSSDAFMEWQQKAQSTESTYPWQNGGKLPSEYTWAEFEALSAEQQMAFQNWFGSIEAFEEWRQKAQSAESTYPWENGGKLPSEYTWAEFEALNAEQQMAFQNWFGSIEAFEEWRQKAQSAESTYPWENGGKHPSEYTWEEFEALSPEEQIAFQNAFDDFYEWLLKNQP